tara:strand:- start:242 stop:460 length:219 start_codon:yes stop_codon:yes gene_type:complete
MSCINSIHLDVTETVKAFYPSLTDQQAQFIAWRISSQWDYSSILDDIAEQIKWDAKLLKIELTDKDIVRGDA